MKTKSIFKILFMSFFVACATIMGCSSDDSGQEPVVAVASSILLSSSANGTLVGGEIVFTVKDNLNNDLTSQASYTVDGVSISSNTYTFTQIGTYDIVATYSGFTSNTLSIIVDEENAIVLSLVEDQSTTTNNEVYFRVFNNLGNNVTDSCVFSIDGVTITNPYQFPAAGDYVVDATYNGFTTSLTVTISRGFTKKILLEDYTGTWCQYCPGAGSAIANAKSENSNIFGVAYHVSYSSSSGVDPMQIPESVFFANHYGITGFPTVHYDGPASPSWNFPVMGQLNTELDEEALLGLAIDAEIVNNKLNVELKVGFGQEPSEDIKLMLYLVEDDVVTSTPQSGSSQGSSYVHKDVLREVYTNQLGDLIPAGSISMTADYERSFMDLSLPSNISNVSNLKVIAFVRNTTSDNDKYNIYNVQEVHVGSSQDFD